MVDTGSDHGCGDRLSLSVHRAATAALLALHAVNTKLQLARDSMVPLAAVRTVIICVICKFMFYGLFLSTHLLQLNYKIFKGQRNRKGLL